MANVLYRITVTDAWYPKEGGNIEVASQQSQIHSMQAVLAGLKGAGVASLRGRGQAIGQSPDSWIEQGKRTLIAGRGICTDCAAAAAVKFLAVMALFGDDATVEIISSGSHAFVVVNRGGPVNTPLAWGKDCFVIDIWLANQHRRGVVAGAFWANDRSHGGVDFIVGAANHLRVDAVLREKMPQLV